MERAYSTELAQHEGLLHRFARMGFGRLQSAGVVIDYEDVYQEMLVSFVKAKEAWNPEFGASFSAYLGQTVWHNFNKFAERELRQVIDIGIVHVGDLSAPDEETLGDGFDRLNVEIEAASAVESYEQTNENKATFKQLSMETKVVLLNLMRPSPSIMAAYKSHNESRERKAPFGVPFLMTALGYKRKTKTRCYSEIQKVYGVSF